MSNARFIIRRLMLKYGSKCFYCNRYVYEQAHDMEPKATIDHYIPKSKGGEDKFKNYRLACARCNRNKGNSMPKELSK